MSPIWYYHSGPELTWEQRQWRGILHSTKHQHHWNITIRLFSVISRTLIVGGGLIPMQRCSWCILQSGQTQLNGFKYCYLLVPRSSIIPNTDTIFTKLNCLKYSYILSIVNHKYFSCIITEWFFINHFQ